MRTACRGSGLGIEGLPGGQHLWALNPIPSLLLQWRCVYDNGDERCSLWCSLMHSNTLNNMNITFVDICYASVRVHNPPYATLHTPTQPPQPHSHLISIAKSHTPTHTHTHTDKLVVPTGRIEAIRSEELAPAPADTLLPVPSSFASCGAAAEGGGEDDDITDTDSNREVFHLRRLNKHPNPANTNTCTTEPGDPSMLLCGRRPPGPERRADERVPRRPRRYRGAADHHSRPKGPPGVVQARLRLHQRREPPVWVQEEEVSWKRRAEKTLVLNADLRR